MLYTGILHGGVFMSKVVWNIFQYITYTSNDDMQILQSVSGNYYEENSTNKFDKYEININQVEITSFAVLGVLAAVVYIFR